MLQAGECDALKLIVCKALLCAVQKTTFTPQKPGTDLSALYVKSGCFVTYKTGGELRGCLGCFTTDQPLYETVSQYATWSATEDPRFVRNRLKKEDLPEVDFDISVLSPLKPCVHPESIRLGTDGIFLRSAGRSGCFLPQVATEQDWTVAEFWGYCCSHKAGLPFEAWKTDMVEKFTFTAEVIEGHWQQPEE